MSSAWPTRGDTSLEWVRLVDIRSAKNHAFDGDREEFRTQLANTLAWMASRT
jgi:hypothetical protein